MARDYRKFFAIALVALVGVAGVNYRAFADRGVPAQEGVGNFAKVTEKLYRGAQPDADGVRSLSRLGVKTIVNLRMPGDVWAKEEQLARDLGIVYTNVPMAGLGRPADAQVRAVLGLVDSLPGPVFIHCQHGCDRTGTIVACYRIQHDGWSLEKSMDEAVHFGMSWLERGMRKYVADFSTAASQVSQAIRPVKTAKAK
jgi:protein tyrosine/serine phosphatase